MSKNHSLEASFMDFQKKHGLKVDGIIGDQTLSKMNRLKDLGELGESEMIINPFIKGFFDIEEARAKNTNIFDESKKLTAAQKKHLDKNDNDKIDAEDFEMLRKTKNPKPGHNASVMNKNISKVLAVAKEEVAFSEEEIEFIKGIMEAMPVAPTSEGDSPNPTPKKKAEGSRAKGSMAD